MKVGSKLRVARIAKSPVWQIFFDIFFVSHLEEDRVTPGKFSKVNTADFPTRLSFYFVFRSQDNGRHGEELSKLTTLDPTQRQLVEGIQGFEGR